MSDPGIDKISRAVSGKEKSEALAILNDLDVEGLKKRIESINTEQVAKVMRSMNLGDAADKLESMTTADLISRLSENPRVLENLKNLFS